MGFPGFPNNETSEMLRFVFVNLFSLTGFFGYFICFDFLAD